MYEHVSEYGNKKIDLELQCSNNQIILLQGHCLLPLYKWFDNKLMILTLNLKKTLCDQSTEKLENADNFCGLFASCFYMYLNQQTNVV